ncbi:MAG TPA: thioredoxin-dependent thiol peroxidase [Candidatus Paceibacterota bacterium]|nr:thioredoxin-dependent thiol peroxidase [Candidatus Paceibacterota bacterium]
MKSLDQIALIGNPAPDFTLKDQDGKLRSLSDWQGQWVILYFYPKDMTSGCTLEAQEFRDHEYEIGDMNAVIIGVSPDDQKSHTKFCQEQSLNFTLLSDTEKEAAEAYDVWKEKSMYGNKYWGVERTTFLIDPAGKVAKIYSKVRPLGHAEAVIADLEKLQK